jgi:hypothetical protein
MIFPVLPGMRDRVRALAASLQGEHRAEYERSQRRAGVTKEVWFLQETPEGDRAIVYMEAKDPNAMMDAAAHSQHPFDVWFREETVAITGIEFDHLEPWRPFETIHRFGV